MEEVWSFVSNSANREAFGWIGGGIVVVLGGLWAVFKHFRGRDQKPAPSIVAKHKSIAAGRDVRIHRDASQ
jgi:hypothetical protein